MMDFSSHAGVSTGSDTIPNAQVAWAILAVRGVKASNSGGEYIDCELTIDDGQPFARRKVWEMIGNPFHQGNSEAYRQMGMVAITRICEAARGASPDNPAGYKLDNFQQLNGLRVPIKIGIEEGEGGRDDKNRVAEWLTPNPASKSGHKHFQRLMRGEYALNSAPAQTQTGGGFGGGAPASTGGFGGGQQTQSGFGQAGNSAGSQQGGSGQTTGFGGATSTPGFQQSQPDSSGQGGFATTAGNQTPTGASASPSSGTSGNWLEQANGGPS